MIYMNLSANLWPVLRFDNAIINIVIGIIVPVLWFSFVTGGTEGCFIHSFRWGAFAKKPAWALIILVNLIHGQACLQHGTELKT